MSPVLKFLFWPVLGLWLCHLSGCTKAAPHPSPAATAHVVVVNLSDCVWQITLTARGSVQSRVSQLPSRASRESDLPGGDYAIEQAIVTENAGLGATRRFNLHLDVGQTYRWRLATLPPAPAVKTGPPEVVP